MFLCFRLLEAFCLESSFMAAFPMFSLTFRRLAGGVVGVEDALGVGAWSFQHPPHGEALQWYGRAWSKADGSPARSESGGQLRSFDICSLAPVGIQTFQSWVKMGLYSGL